MLKQCVFLILLTLVLNVGASQSLTEKQVSDRIDTLVEDNVTPPKQIMHELDKLITLSQESGWTENYVKANILKAENLAFLEKLKEAEAIITKVHPIALENNFHRLNIRFQLVKLSITDATGYTPEVQTLIDSVLLAAEVWGKSREAGSIYSTVGQSYYMHKMFDKSITYLKYAYDIYHSLNDEENLGFTLNSLSNLYSELGDFDTSLTYLTEAIKITRKSRDLFSISIMLYNRGKTYTLANKLELALDSLNESLSLAIEIDDDMGIIWAKQAIADIYVKQIKPNQALSLFNETAQVFKLSGDNREYFHALQGKFDSYYLLNELDQCEQLKSELERLATLLNNADYKANLIKRYAQLSAKQNNHKLAYSKMVEYIDQKTLLFEEEKKTNIQELKVAFDTEVTTQKNTVLQKENELHQLMLNQKNNEKVLWLVISCMAFILILFIVILLHRQIKSRNEYKALALKDVLTNSPNRRAILRTAEIMLEQCKATDCAFSIGIIDLDKFKQVNDVYGHDTGDEVLKSFANACRETLRKRDNFGRYGGEEWLFVFDESDNEAIFAIFQRIRAQLNETAITGYPDDLTINFSVGIASYSSATENSLQQLIKKADAHLYKSKELGRNSITFGGANTKHFS